MTKFEKILYIVSFILEVVKTVLTRSKNENK